MLRQPPAAHPRAQPGHASFAALAVPAALATLSVGGGCSERQRRRRRLRAGAADAVGDAAAAAQRRAHHVHAGADGDRRPAAARAGWHGRRRHRPATAAARVAGAEQGGRGVVSRTGAAAVAVGAALLRAADAGAQRGAAALPVGHAEPAAVAGGRRGGARERAGAGDGPGAGPSSRRRRRRLFRRRRRPAAAGAPVGHGSGAAGGHHVLAARLGLVLRGPLVAGERRPAAGDGARHLPGARLLRPALPLLAERADGARPHQHPPALRVRQLPAGRRAAPGAAHAALRLRRQARRVLRGVDAQPPGEQNAARQRTGVGGRAGSDVLAHPAALPALQEAAVAQPAASRAVGHQQTVEGGRQVGVCRCAQAAPAHASTVLHQGVPVHVLKGACLLICELLTLCRWERSSCDIEAQSPKSVIESNSNAMRFCETEWPMAVCELRGGRGGVRLPVACMNSKRHRTESVLRSRTLECPVLQRHCRNLLVLQILVLYLLQCYRAEHRGRACPSIACVTDLVPSCRYISVFY